MNDRQTHALASGSHVDCYRIESVLGSGAFGITYAAQDLELNRRVAVKEYFPVGFAQRAAGGSTIGPSSDTHVELYNFGRAQFVNEARVLAQFSERNIVPIYRFLEANDTAYVVMNYEDGHTLARVIKRHAQLDERQLLALAIHMLRGLSAVHSKGILHGDVKPGNILVRRSGPPLLIDFGAARLAVGRKRGSIKSVMTPQFSPLELFGSEGREGPWTDIYALGATLFQCATGKLPPLITDRLDAMQSGRPDPAAVGLGRRSDRHSRELIDTIDWMLKPAAQARPQTCAEALDQFIAIFNGRARGNRPAAARPREPGPLPTTSAPTGAGAIGARMVSAAQEALTEAVGPIAAILVERAAHESANESMFLEQLASKVPDIEQRGSFMAACRPYLPHTAKEALGTGWETG